MADVRKTVEIALNVVGIDQSKIRAVSSSFTKISTTVDSATNSINKFKSMLESIKTPASLDKVVTSFKRLISTDIGGLVGKLQTLNSALVSLEKRGNVSVFKSLASDVTNTKAALSTATSSMNKVTTSMREAGNVAQSTGLQLRTFADKVKTVLTFRLISDALVNLKLAITSGVSAIVSYDQALKSLQAITVATT